MNTKNTLAVLVAIAIGSSAAIHIAEYSSDSDLENKNVQVLPFTSAEGVTVTITATESTSDSVLFSGLGYVDQRASLIESASGAKYKLAIANFIIWNKGDELLIQEGDDVLFLGIKGTSTPTTQTEEEGNQLVELNATELLVGGTWEWEKALSLNNQEIILPVKPETFTITLHRDQKITTTSDCSEYSGTYVLNTELFVSDLSQTESFCESNQEDIFKNMFTGSSTILMLNSESFRLENDSYESYFKRHLVPL